MVHRIIRLSSKPSAAQEHHLDDDFANGPAPPRLARENHPA
jgi:hypothetical protein